jgi:hypothetical protein
MVISGDQSGLLPFHVVIVSTIILALIVFALAALLREKLFARYARKMARIVILASKPDGELSDGWITKVAEYLIPVLARGVNEGDRSFAERVLSELHIKSVRSERANQTPV